MPTISQLPTATSVSAADEVPISQAGVAHAVSVGNLLAGTQPAILAPTNTLLGRKSLGAGGPEPLGVGDGLILHDGTLSAFAGNLPDSPSTMLGTDERFIVSKDGALHLANSSVIRSVFSAGEYISISASGVISATGPMSPDAGSGGTLNIATLPRVTGPAADDLVVIHHGGVAAAIRYADLLNARTIDEAPPAGPVSDGDQFWVGQGSAILARQTMGALWQWLSSKLPAVRQPIVELETDTVLDVTVHNGRMLVCGQPLTISALFQNMGSGFHCEVINLSSGDVTFGAGFYGSSGGLLLKPGQCSLVRAISSAQGSTVHAILCGGAAPQTPGPATDLVADNLSTNSIGLTWTAPQGGEPPVRYAVRYRPSGTASWITATDSCYATSFLLTGLLAGLSYEIAVTTIGRAGEGPASAVLNVALLPGAASPGVATNVAAVPQSSDTILVSWSPPASGTPVTSYTLQYRVAGASLWSAVVAGLAATAKLVTGLAPTTTYEFRVYGTSGDSAGPFAPPVSATTMPPSGSVTAIQWNLTPSGPYTRSAGSVGVNVRVTPAASMVRLGFSTSETVRPANWTPAVHVNTDVWGAYVATPDSPGAWYAWAEGMDGSASTVFATPFSVL